MRRACRMRYKIKTTGGLQLENSSFILSLHTFLLFPTCIAVELINDGDLLQTAERSSAFFLLRFMAEHTNRNDGFKALNMQNEQGFSVRTN